jgi:flagellar motor switch protein FliM
MTMEARMLSQTTFGGPAGGSDVPQHFAETLDKFAEACIPHFEKLAGESMVLNCRVAALTQETVAEFFGSLEPLMVNATFDVPATGSHLVVSLDHAFVQLVIELMCGGTCSEPVPDEPRPGTAIDRQFARVALNTLASTLEKECLGFGLTSVSFAQIETKMDPAVLGKRSARVSVATVDLECRKRRASLRIAFPQPVIDCFKQDAVATGTDGASGDPIWTEHFQSEIGRTTVRLDAMIDANGLTLGDVAKLQVGQMLALPRNALTRCELRNGDKLLFLCEVGQAEGRYSLRIDDAAPDSATPSVFLHP